MSRAGHKSSALVGRQRELRELASWTEQGSRLISIVGAPGVGKTRLATELAAMVRTSFRRDIPPGLAELASCATVEQLCAQVARATRMPPDLLGQGDPVEATGHWLSLAGRAMLVLDNLEHLLPEARPVVESWLARAADLTVVVTTRAALEAVQERVFELEPLSLPPRDSRGDAEVRASEAVQLFFQHAGLHGDRLTGPGSAARVAQVVTRLDGNPLAIGLAAARLEVLSIDGLCQQITDHFKVLRDPLEAPARHQTMWRAVSGRGSY
jgi:predicted ATPase